MNKYETVVIFGPDSSNEEMDVVLNKITTTITEKGEMKNVFDWGRKRFAYPINKKTEGHYFLITFDGTSELPLELNRIARITESLFRLRVYLRDDSVPAASPRKDRRAVDKKSALTSVEEEVKLETAPSEPPSLDPIKEVPAQEIPVQEVLVQEKPIISSETTEAQEDVVIIEEKEVTENAE